MVGLVKPHYWTPERIIASIQSWAEKHGRHPLAVEWTRAAPEHPARPTVERLFGSWNAGMAAAGFEGRRSGGNGAKPYWDKDLIVTAFLDFLFREGRWPTTTDCGQPRPGRPGVLTPGLPCWRTVARHHGSFVAAKYAAGWDPAAKKRRTRPTTCSGCDCDMDMFTIGCKVCIDRRNGRRRRTRPAYLESERLRARRRRDRKLAAACRLAAVESSPADRDSRSGSDSQTRRAA